MAECWPWHLEASSFLRFPVRAQARAMGSIPSRGRAGGSRSMLMFLSLAPFLSLKSTKAYFKKEE